MTYIGPFPVRGQLFLLLSSLPPPIRPYPKLASDESAIE